MHTRSFVSALLMLLATSGLVSPALSDSNDDGWEKVVFHVDESRYARWVLMLARAYHEDSPKAKIVIVAYGPGVDFLLDSAEDSNGSPYAPALFELTTMGVDIRLCGTTLRERQIPTERVVDGIKIVPSGVSEIARLQLKEGYAYLKP